jgi:hypothetical protein
MSTQEEVKKQLQAMKWTEVLDALVAMTIQNRPANVLPPGILGWFDIDRENPPAPAEQESIQKRLDEALRSGFDLSALEERAPLGSTGWWAGLAHYRRDGKRWWLLRLFRADMTFAGVPMQARLSDPELGLARRFVAHLGGDSSKPPIDTGAALIWTWLVGAS